MKILYIEPVRLPTEKAHGIQIMEMCAAFKRQGADIALLVSDRKTPIHEDPFAYYDIGERFQIRRLSAPDFVRYGKVGFKIFLFIFALRAAFYVRRNHADLVYTRTPDVARMLTRCTRVPVILEMHARQAISHRVLRRLALLVPITNSLASWYQGIGMPKSRILVAPDAVDVRRFEINNRTTVRDTLRMRLGVPADARIALYLGSFGVYSWKGVDIAKAAAAYAPEVTWLFIGGSDMECVALKNGATENVKTLPRAKRTEVAALLAAADVLLLPNKSGDIISEQDTSPLKLFEYMASGVPIVASDLPSIREVLDSNSAYFVEPNNPETLAKKVTQVLQSGLDVIDKVEHARLKVKSFTWDGRVRIILDRLR